VNAENIVAHKYKKGQSGNPKGKPKGATSIVTELRRFMDKKMVVNDPVTGQPTKMKIGRLLAMSLIKSASKGNVPAITEIMNRLDGKVSQPMELAGAGGMPLTPPTIVFEATVSQEKVNE